jgi:glycosyltransferase involved in cell wall biosynthesis
LSEQKGQRYLISAFARLRREQPDNPVRLVLLGDGELRQELEAQVTAEKMSDHILFAGFRPDIPELLQAVDVIVFSSLFEGLPIALLEAMAAARPLVCTDIPGNLDAVRDDREALIVRTADADSLAQALGRITRDTALRQRLGQGARQRFLDQFTAAAMVGHYEDLYHQVLAVRKIVAR